MDWWYCKEKNLFLLSNFATKPKNAVFHGFKNNTLLLNKVAVT